MILNRDNIYIKILAVLMCFLLCAVIVIKPIHASAISEVVVTGIVAIIISVLMSSGIAISSTNSSTTTNFFANSFSQWCNNHSFDKETISANWLEMKKGIMKINSSLYNTILSFCSDFISDYNLSSSASSTTSTISFAYDYTLTSIDGNTVINIPNDVTDYNTAKSMGIVHYDFISDKIHFYYEYSTLYREQRFYYTSSDLSHLASTVYYGDDSYERSNTWRTWFTVIDGNLWLYSDTSYGVYRGDPFKVNYGPVSNFFSSDTITATVPADTTVSVPTQVNTAEVPNVYINTGTATSDLATGSTAVITSTTVATATEVAENVPTIELEEPASSKYGVSGLQDIFPFCIPFDIYDIFANFQATREAPELRIHMDNDLLFFMPADWEYDFVVDFSDWDTVATILRTMELIAFIVGLAFLSRKLIGAGG